MITFLQSKLGDRHGHCNFPSFHLFVKRPPQFLYEIEKFVLVGKATASIRGAWVLPIQIKTIEIVLFHEINHAPNKATPSFLNGNHRWILRSTFRPSPYSNLKLHIRVFALQPREIPEAVILNVELLKKKETIEIHTSQSRASVRNYLRVDDEHTPWFVVDADERVNDVSTQTHRDVVYAVFTHARAVNGPIAEVTYHSGRRASFCLHKNQHKVNIDLNSMNVCAVQNQCVID